MVGPSATFLARLRGAAAGEAVALGVDLPLGLPRDFAARHVTEPDFPSFLRALAGQPAFFEVCADLTEVCPGRPFYPARGQAGVRRVAHAAALGFATATSISRLCDRATAERPAGAPLFWTLGANQTGKAAIAAWREMLLPALAGPDPPRLWPFKGPFCALLAPGVVAIAETYPAEALRQLGLRLAGSKRRQMDRAALAGGLRGAMAALDAKPDTALATAIADGFGADPAGEDRFDCVLGLLAVLQVLAGRRPDRPPDDPALLRWEGWVLGRPRCPADFYPSAATSASALRPLAIVAARPFQCTPPTRAKAWFAFG